MTKTRKVSKLTKQHPECEGLTFHECERMILQNVVDELEREQGAKLLQQPSIQEIISILESFLVKKKRLCYGGTAINNLLPKEDQFYDLDIEFPDYDFYSPAPINDAKTLADQFAQAGYVNVEAKAGVHIGTYKVFVDFIPVADITHMQPSMYQRLKARAVKRRNIYYVPPNFLRMSMYLELSRPHGAISRWEKVFDRLNLLNKHYPLTGKNCTTQRGKLSQDIHIQRTTSELPQSILQALYRTTRKVFVDQGIVFFGAYAHQLYSKYMPSSLRRKTQAIPDFDGLCENLEEVVDILKREFQTLPSIVAHTPALPIRTIHHPPIGEILPEHVEFRVGEESVCFLYRPIACHSYNTIKIKQDTVRVATIDTMLSFYLAFLFANRSYYDEQRITCMSDFLFRVQERNRLAQKGVLRRFTMSCYGTQETLRDIRAKKNRKHRELRKTMKRHRVPLGQSKALRSPSSRRVGTPGKTLKQLEQEYEAWFLKYNPVQTPHANKHIRNSQL